jgi:50S ribosomal protein L4
VRFETIPANYLNLPTRRDILHRAVVFEGDAARRGTASTKYRSEVHGSNVKIRPQKGSGHARLGNKKSPMLRGGGVAFGPRPRDFASDLPKKVYHLAWRTALSYRFKKGELIIVDRSLEIEKPSAKLVRELFAIHGWGHATGRSLLITENHRPFLHQALEQAPREGRLFTWDEVDVKNLLEHSRIIIERSALRNILITHAEDLHRASGVPKEKDSGNADLQSQLGWSEFVDLQAAEPEEVETLTPAIYQRVGNQRLEEAEALKEAKTKGSAAQARAMEMSAHELLRDAAALQADIEQKNPDIALADLEPDDDLYTEEKKIFGMQQQQKVLQCQIDSTEHDIQLLELQGEPEEEIEAQAEELKGLYQELETRQYDIDVLMGVVPDLEAEEMADEEVESQIREEEKDRVIDVEARKQAARK